MKYQKKMINNFNCCRKDGTHQSYKAKFYKIKQKRRIMLFRLKPIKIE